MKKLWIALGIVLALAAAVWVGRPLYRNWKQTRLVTQARASWQQGDYRNAGLSARQALQANPANVDACRILAEITEALRLPNALEWRQRIVDLEPDSFTNRLELARCGILLGNYAAAARALRGVAPRHQNTAAFHQMAAMVAVGLNDLAAGERHFAEALRLDPANKLLQFNQAVIHLQAKDQSVVAGALQSLEQLYADPAFRQDALRHLALAAARHRDFAKAAIFTRELQADPKAPLSDRLLHLTMLKDGGESEFGAYLAGLEAACAADGEQVNVLASWLLAHELADEAGRWLAGLPAKMQTNAPVALARADCFMAQKDWAGLQAHLQDANWAELDCLRLAMLARAGREQRQDFTAQTQWRLAVRAALERPKQLAALARLAGQWHWAREQEETLWLIADRFPAERWALPSLARFYLAEGNTRGLLKVYTRQVDYDAKDAAARNNLATLSLLLNVQTNRAHALAREVWRQAPGNAAFASTYAWSLHLQGRTAEGLKVLESLKPDRLEIPTVALYYGAMQAAAHDSSKARKYLDLAATGKLLPEEKTLLEEAKRGL
jgi:Tfp pilus assembly protein PilF